MIKVLSAKQIKELDAWTIRQEPIPSIDLMERACRAFVNWFVTHFHEGKRVGIVCGTGNNGGDGLGIARQLKERGYNVSVWIVRGSVPETEDFKINLKRLNGKVEIKEITKEADRGLFINLDVLIDGVFGSGLSRKADGIYAQVIDCINKSESTKVAIDIPSGLMADGPSEGNIVNADYTLSFQLPKLAFFLPQSAHYTGEWTLVDIGLKKDFIQKADSEFGYVTERDACKLLKPRSKFDHKGTFGHCLLIAGSHGKIGAAILATRAALRSGSGLVSAHLPKCGYQIMQSSVPEAMVLEDSADNYFANPPSFEKFTAIGIGPGLGQHPETVSAFEKVLKDFKKPMVIDADGLNILSLNKSLFKLIPAGSILTPHPKEFERIVGSWSNDFEKLSKLKALAVELKSVIVLKGAFTAIASADGKIVFNSTGNPAMATGGTGDVLTGILTGLLAQSYFCTEAAILGVYLHGLAGDLAVRDRGRMGLIASDLIEYLPFSFKKLVNG